MNGEDDWEEVTEEGSARGTVLIVFIHLSLGEDSGEVRRGGGQVRSRLDAHDCGIGHDGVLVGEIEGVDEEIHFLGVVGRVVEIISRDTRITHPPLEGEFEHMEPLVVASRREPKPGAHRHMVWWKP